MGKNDFVFRMVTSSGHMNSFQKLFSLNSISDVQAQLFFRKQDVKRIY